jgi:hypothetical protein
MKEFPMKKLLASAAIFALSALPLAAQEMPKWRSMPTPFWPP